MSIKDSKPLGQEGTQCEEENICVVEQLLPTQRIQQRLKEMPIVDKQKVEEIKQQLNNYDFNIDPQRIAQKIISLENELLSEEEIKASQATQAAQNTLISSKDSKIPTEDSN